MHSKSRRIAAIIGVVLLLLLYAINFFIGIFCDANTFSLFMASLLATFFIPVIIYCYTYLMKVLEKKRSDEDTDNE